MKKPMKKTRVARVARRARRATVAGLDGLVPNEWAQLSGVGVEFMVLAGAVAPAPAQVPAPAAVSRWLN